MKRLLTVLIALTVTSALNTDLDQVRQLQKNFESLATKFRYLETKLQEQESIFKILGAQLLASQQLDVRDSEHVPSGYKALPRTCLTAQLANPLLASGLYWIDPDGPAYGEDPIRVFCNMNTGWTEVLHDSDSPMSSGHCTSPGCYSRSVNYNGTMRQIAALIELSAECSQSIKYDCVSSPLERNGISYAWWNDRNGNSQYFWSGSNSRIHICQCGIEQTCFENDVKCNCDSDAKLPLADQGAITRKELLPVTRLNFGRTQRPNSTGIHTLGRLLCDGQLAVANKGLPTSCADLWRSGFVNNGLYSVKGNKQLEKVYCNFSKLPSQPDFQMWIGYEDVKLQSIPARAFKAPVALTTSRD